MIVFGRIIRFARLCATVILYHVTLAFYNVSYRTGDNSITQMYFIGMKSRRQRGQFVSEKNDMSIKLPDGTSYFVL